MTRPDLRKARVPGVALVLANGLRVHRRAVAKAARPFADLQPAAVAATVVAEAIVNRWHSHTMGQPS